MTDVDQQAVTRLRGDLQYSVRRFQCLRKITSQQMNEGEINPAQGNGGRMFDLIGFRGCLLRVRDSLGIMTARGIRDTEKARTSYPLCPLRLFFQEWDCRLKQRSRFGELPLDSQRLPYHGRRNRQ